MFSPYFNLYQFKKKRKRKETQSKFDRLSAGHEPFSELWLFYYNNDLKYKNLDLFYEIFTD